MQIDVNETVWVATHRGGLNCFDKNTQTFANYQYNSNDPNSLSANSVRAIWDNGDGTLWIGTSKGLDLFNSQNGTVIRHYASAPVRALLKSVDGLLWVATEAGVYRFDANSTLEPDANSTLEPNPKNAQPSFTAVNLPGLASPSSRALLRDEQGNIWIATTKGLFKYHHTTGQVTAFEQGLSRFGVGG
jgi:ligand-binding sensor domain-containing protein